LCDFQVFFWFENMNLLQIKIKYAKLLCLMNINNRTIIVF
jgi:hypothetical protein